jgi:hypothetical protein
VASAGRGELVRGTATSSNVVVATHSLGLELSPTVSKFVVGSWYHSLVL